mgnify:CR=1 FL=1
MSLIHFIVYNIIKKGKKEFDKNNPPDYVLRREQEIQSRAPKNVKVEQIANDGVNGEYLSKGNNPEDKVLMYIHGGGFVGSLPHQKEKRIPAQDGNLYYKRCNRASLPYIPKIRF